MQNNILKYLYLPTLEQIAEDLIEQYNDIKSYLESEQESDNEIIIEFKGDLEEIRYFIIEVLTLIDEFFPESRLHGSGQAYKK